MRTVLSMTRLPFVGEGGLWLSRRLQAEPQQFAHYWSGLDQRDVRPMLNDIGLPGIVAPVQFSALSPSAACPRRSLVASTGAPSTASVGQLISARREPL